MLSENREIRALIEEFVERLAVVVHKASVDAAVNALKNTRGVGTDARGPSRQRSVGTGPGKGPRRSGREIQKTLNRVVAFVEANPASRSEDIKKGSS